MTDEAKQLFGTPWKTDGTNVTDRYGRHIALLTTNDTMAQLITYLPELYDKLLIASRVYCPYACLNCTTEKECPHITIRTGIAKRCAALPWLRLLKRVKDSL